MTSDKEQQDKERKLLPPSIMSQWFPVTILSKKNSSLTLGNSTWKKGKMAYLYLVPLSSLC